MNILVLFDPLKEDFRIDWRLKGDSYTCYKELTGTCSLFLNSPIDNLDLNSTVRGSFGYYKGIDKNIQELGITKFSKVYFNIEPILGFYNRMFYITDGTHRLCICKQRNLKYPVRIGIKESDLIYIDKKDILEILNK